MSQSINYRKDASEALWSMRVRLAVALRGTQESEILTALRDFDSLDEDFYRAAAHWQDVSGTVEDVQGLLLKYPAATLLVMDKCGLDGSHGRGSPQRPFEREAILVWLMLRATPEQREVESREAYRLGRRSWSQGHVPGLENIEALPYIKEPTDRDVALALIACKAGLTASEIAAAMQGEVDLAALAVLACLQDEDLGPWAAHLS